MKAISSPVLQRSVDVCGVCEAASVDKGLQIKPCGQKLQLQNVPRVESRRGGSLGTDQADGPENYDKVRNERGKRER